MTLCTFLLCAGWATLVGNHLTSIDHTEDKVGQASCIAIADRAPTTVTAISAPYAPIVNTWPGDSMAWLKDLRGAHLNTYQEVKRIPACVQKELDRLAGGHFRIVNPSEKWQAGCVNTANLPARQLTYLGFNAHFLLMTYLTGGIAVTPHVLVIQYEGQKVKHVWKVNTYRALASKKAIMDYVEEHQYKSDLWHRGSIVL